MGSLSPNMAFDVCVSLKCVPSAFHRSMHVVHMCCAWGQCQKMWLMSPFAAWHWSCGHPLVPVVAIQGSAAFEPPMLYASSTGTNQESENTATSQNLRISDEKSPFITNHWSAVVCMSRFLPQWRSHSTQNIMDDTTARSPPLSPRSLPSTTPLTSPLPMPTPSRRFACVEPMVESLLSLRLSVLAESFAGSHSIAQIASAFGSSLFSYMAPPSRPTTEK